MHEHKTVLARLSYVETFSVPVPPHGDSRDDLQETPDL